ncbi:adenylate/guanylate cyclase catalytic domain protein [Leptospira ellinghausenii]|uniref:Adenylate/guanylate cyclase catalytic domain protein n=1 Tax=Leptospira ellinghausenii TaxID=1917822 RepID=A0A2P2DAT3_9LEPT|nr:adenylate/guanylate cyclase domain-containing protein [Leptospira ellinghausenii]GBF41678.1 adenylate/guanylate cyclase catalytic domain protein [Leptospira ellinghausenii]
MQIIFYDKETTRLKSEKKGTTILETALKHDYPLYHLCGGNAKCTTCRVYVSDGISNLSNRNEREQLLAERKGWPTEIRLACQTEVFGDIGLRRIIRDNKDLKTVTSESKSSKTGEECFAVILFLDIKGFTSFTESNLAYDVVFVLNRFFHEMSEPILNNGGEIDKFIGDGILAFFQIPNETGSKQSQAEEMQNLKTETMKSAIRACLRMFDQLKKFNIEMKDRFNFTFDIRLGLHAGNVIYGDIGHSEFKSQTVLGDVVNVASRLEALNKKTNTRFLVSDVIYDTIGTSLSIDKKVITKLRGKSDVMKAYSVIGFKGKDPILFVQQYFDHLNAKNPNWIHNYENKLESFRNKKVNLENSNETTDEALIPLHQILESIVDKLGNPKTLKKVISKLANHYQMLSIPRENFSKLVSVFLNSLEETSSELWNNEISLVLKEVWTDITIQLLES